MATTAPKSAFLPRFVSRGIHVFEREALPIALSLLALLLIPGSLGNALPSGISSAPQMRLAAEETGHWHACNVLFLIDVSASMSDLGMMAAHGAVRTVFDTLTQIQAESDGEAPPTGEHTETPSEAEKLLTGSVGVISFADHATGRGWAHRDAGTLNGILAGAVRKKDGNLTDGVATNWSAALRAATDNRGAQPSLVIMLTDGQPTVNTRPDGTFTKGESGRNAVIDPDDVERAIDEANLLRAVLSQWGGQLHGIYANGQADRNQSGYDSPGLAVFGANWHEMSWGEAAKRILVDQCAPPRVHLTESAPTEAWEGEAASVTCTVTNVGRVSARLAVRASLTALGDGPTIESPLTPVTLAKPTDSGEQPAQAVGVTMSLGVPAEYDQWTTSCEVFDVVSHTDRRMAVRDDESWGTSRDASTEGVLTVGKLPWPT